MSFRNRNACANNLTLALGLWNAGSPGRISCRVGIRRPGEETTFLGEGDTTLSDPGEMALLPLKLTLTFERPGTYWAVCEFDGVSLVEVPFSVSEAPPPAMAPPVR